MPRSDHPARTLAATPVPAALADAPDRVIRRSCRVLLAVGVIGLISLADLYLTLLYARTVGFHEGNPLARWVMQLNCPWLLGAWKSMLVALTCGILIACRRSRTAELGAWIGVGVMVWLAMQWASYAAAAPAMTQVLHEVAEGNPTWVQMP